MAKKYLDNNGLLYFWGKLKAYFAQISHTHTKSEITDFPSSMTPTSHTHGNITNAGALQTTDVAIANGDKLVVTDSSNSNKIARTGTSFDGSTTTKALTQKGTFETFLQEHQDISGKVDKISGKGLSTEDYTTAEKTKLSGIATGAEVNVQSDWNQTNTSADDYIKNKPTLPVGNGRVFYGTCSTAASTANKEITCTSYDNLTVGDIVIVNFTNINSNSSPRFNVNSTGNMQIAFYKNGNRTTINAITKGLIGHTKMFIYDGTFWIMCPENTDTTYSDATTTTAGLMSTTDKTKIDGIATGAEVNQNAFSNVKVGNTTIEADTKTDTLELASSGSVAIGMSPDDDKIIISATDTTYNAGTSSDLNTGTVTYQRVWSPKILHDYVEGAISTAISGVASFQGVAPTTFAPTNYKAGWYWLVDTDGTYAGEVCEAGDFIYAISDYSSAYSANDFTVVQNNLDLADISNSDIDTIVAS